MGFREWQEEKEKMAEKQQKPINEKIDEVVTDLGEIIKSENLKTANSFGELAERIAAHWEENGKEIKHIIESVEELKTQVAELKNSLQPETGVMEPTLSMPCKAGIARIEQRLKNDAGYKIVFGWVLLCISAAMAQKIFGISGFVGLWSWFKIITGLKILSGMF